jgi:hypothetical protein
MMSPSPQAPSPEGQRFTDDPLGFLFRWFLIPLLVVLVLDWARDVYHWLP